MEYIRVTAENLEKEHICCAISNRAVKIDSREYVTNEQMNDKKFLKLAGRG